MARLPILNPGNKLTSLVKYSFADKRFLISIKPWSADHYKGKADSPTKNREIQRIKEFIRKELITIQNNYCAFCGLDLNIVKEFHREHIAPQSQHNHYIFTPENLVLACYDCNDAKGKSKTVITDTEKYKSTNFLILHPYRDNFGDFIIPFYENGGLWFEVIRGVTDDRADKTIKILGLQDPKLIKERGMRIKNALIPVTPQEDEIIREICSISPRKQL